MRAREAKTQLKQLASSTADLRYRLETYLHRFCGMSESLLPTCPVRTGDLSEGSWDCTFFFVDEEGGTCVCQLQDVIDSLRHIERKATEMLERRGGDDNP